MFTTIAEKWGPEFWMLTAALTIVWDKTMLDPGEPFDAFEIAKVLFIAFAINAFVRKGYLRG